MIHYAYQSVCVCVCACPFVRVHSHHQLLSKQFPEIYLKTTTVNIWVFLLVFLSFQQTAAGALFLLSGSVRQATADAKAKSSDT